MEERDKLLKMYNDEMLYRNFSKSTARTYYYHLLKFLNTVKKQSGKITPDDIQNYLLSCLKRKLSHSTMTVIRSALKLYAHKCLNIKELEFVNSKVKSQRKIRKVLSVAEIKLLISCARTIRDQTILLALFTTGMRSAEVINIQVKDIDSTRMIIYVRQGKGHKDRIIPLSNELLLALRHYYKIYKPGNWLFPDNEKSGPIPVRYVAAIWNYVKKKSALDIIGGVHLLRNCFATHMLDQNVNIHSIQQVLGHSSIRSTVRYLNFTSHAASECAAKIDKLLSKNQNSSDK